MKQFYKTIRKSMLVSIIMILLACTGYSGNFQLEEMALTHYTTVWQGENGQNHMNFMVVSAILEDLALSANDEIAVFSGEKCVGVMQLTQAINPTDNATFLNIPASQDDGLNNGFTDNDTVIFKIWDNKNQKEMVAKAVTYLNDLTSWTTSGKFAAGATSVVEIVSYQESTQSIELIKGYNMISTNVIPQNANVSDVTKSLLDMGSLVKVQDEAGNSYENWGAFGGWVNNLGSIAKTEGYKIKVVNNCTLQLIGRPIVLPLDIPLFSGWNIISFPNSNIVSAMSVIQPLIDQNKLVKVQDEAGNSIEDWGIFGGWKNNIGNFLPGKAYKVKMNANATLTIQENYLKSAIIQSEISNTEYYPTSVEGNGTDQMNINIVDLKAAGLSVGDELAAFNGKICVGALKITEEHLATGASIIAMSSADNQIGFKDGDLIQLYAWNNLSGNEFVVQSETVKGNMIYEMNGSVLIKMKSLTTVSKNRYDLARIDVFPNPGVGKVTVRFSELPEAGSSIDILDISGKLIVSRQISGTSEVFNLESQPAGIYLVKSKLMTSETIQKLVIQK
ncbi:MAG: T9SS type A sorting domain-containing protein [Prolixibacteraceae bacterium]|nr:T9SS type A sorting domain-containing protein [Prolixibacteraceae bacterium]